MNSRELLSRRSLLRQAAGFSFGLGATNALFDLRLLNNAVAATNVSDYKALVCLFMSGGNDGHNMIVPWDDTRYGNYRTVRGERLALWRDAAEAAARPTIAGAANPNAYYGIPLTGQADTGYAVHNAMTGVQSLYNQNKLAFLPGVGTLVEPMTRAQYRAGTRRKPPQLFSHNDQVTEWMTSVPDQISRTGWGGRTIDKMKEELIRTGIPNGSISKSVLGWQQHLGGGRHRQPISGRHRGGRQFYQLQRDPENAHGQNPPRPWCRRRRRPAGC